METGIQQLQLQQVMHLFAEVQRGKEPSSSIPSPKKYGGLGEHVEECSAALLNVDSVLSV